MNFPSVKAPVIETRLTHQARRIASAGTSLTAGERQELVAQQKDIYKDLYQAKTDDGHLDRHERAELRQDLRQASQDIFVAKHNGTSAGC